ncbi:MAG: efflux RND transporter permease subunit [Gammaproteobacteria bacterium]|jgi:hydrophobic/amphiphilic exporter-1 (mainly G- bacteria), HAE1 family|nr:efflux RND transporter permease subunit [Gammaproteobacteria bacterium]MBT5205240.1 efflux RND transporter permease subunit [Gammaproteobacteria bacterium]MBT5602708.1 efflux RND transporter permease subunit [Gammaproteobacteria bacterium]MBT6244998.1 efflux RND transporter permease subunit [Gammaproteobacteria bacterium]
MNIARFAVNRPVTIVMFFIGLALIGIFSSSRLQLEFFPEMEIPFVGIGIPYINASPEEVEENVTRPVEEVLSLMSGVEEMSTYTRPGFLFVRIILDVTRDVAGKGIEAKELIENIRHRLPEQVRYIQLRQTDPNSSPVQTLMITAPKLDQQSAYELLEKGLKMHIERIPGINSVQLFGVQKDYVGVVIDAARVESFGLDILEIQNRLRRENFFVSAGKIESEPRELRVRPLGQFETLEDIRTLPFGDKQVRLESFADVSFVPEEWSERRRVNGQASLGISIFKKPEANLVEVSRLIDREIAKTQQNPDYQDIAFTPLDSQASTVLKALNDLRDSGLLGAMLSVVTLMLFLRRISVSVLIAATVPLSLFATLGVMYFLGMTLNILSLVGLMLAIGLLVDNAVVSSEAIAYRVRLKQQDSFKAAEDGVRDIALAITAGTLTTIIVFVPSFMTDIQQVAVIQQNIAIPLCVSLVASLFIAQTTVPAVMARLPVVAEPDHPVIDFLSRQYSRVIQLALRYKLLTLVLSALIAWSSLWAYEQLEVNMNPDEESPRLDLNYSMRGSMDLDGIEEFVDRIEDYLIENKTKFQIADVFSSYSVDKGNTYISLTEDSNISPKVIERMIEKDLPQTPDLRVKFGGRHRGFGGGGEDSLSVRLIGSSTERLIDSADQLVATLEQYPGLINVRTDSESRRQEVLIKVKPEQAGQLGLTAADIARSVSAMFGSQLNRGFQVDDREFDIWMGMGQWREKDLNDLQNTPLFLNTGETVPLKTVADLKIQNSLRLIKRDDRETNVNIQFGLDEITPPEAGALVETIMERFNLPAGYRWEMGKEFGRDDEMLQEMVINTIFAILLIYMLIAALFESVLFPIAVVTSIFFSAVGVFWFLYVTGTTFTSMALTGMLLLAGIVVNNGIVLLNRIMQLRRSGMDRLEAILESGRHRLRPILMTTCTTVAGLLPLALGDVRVGGMGPSYLPMARTIMGGLVFSTLITLVLLPVIYVLLDDMKLNTKRAVRLFLSRIQAAR